MATKVMSEKVFLCGQDRKSVRVSNDGKWISNGYMMALQDYFPAELMYLKLDARMFDQDVFINKFDNGNGYGVIKPVRIVEEFYEGHKAGTPCVVFDSGHTLGVEILKAAFGSCYISDWRRAMVHAGLAFWASCNHDEEPIFITHGMVDNTETHNIIAVVMPRRNGAWTITRPAAIVSAAAA